ncbi:uncharacterized protein LOC131843381 [Achroia grisella]|uniref:uncharacterized protein LOC131843381 n=1 Tax=Achroia grisella TaxID=688607 RepID=UPI0027D25038|nr:uncharacterized protein LOC131843381 [Achroia grisella]
MNEILQKHGCANVFSVPEGLKELMSDITREVLREQPDKIFDFIANYLSVLLITREHGILAVRILDDLCDCRPSVSEHLLLIGMERNQAETLAQVIKTEIVEFEPTEGKEKIKESLILKKILTRATLDEDMAAKVCQVARNAYRDYWYRKKLMEQNLKVQPDQPWEIAAEHTLALYKKTKPSLSELTRATQKIQAAYRGYHVRRNLLRHLKPKPKKMGPKVDLLGPPLDVADSREIDLGPIINIQVRKDDVGKMFEKHAAEQLGLLYDPMRTITHVDDKEILEEEQVKTAEPPSKAQNRLSELEPSKEVEMPRQSNFDPAALGNVKSRHLSIVPEPIHIDDIATPRQLESNKNYPLGQTHEVSVPKKTISDLSKKIVTENMEKLKDIPDATITITNVPADQPIVADIAQEIPEDIPDDRTDGDGESAPTTSIPSATPDTADGTDMEDDGILDTTGEDDEGA